MGLGRGPGRTRCFRRRRPSWVAAGRVVRALADPGFPWWLRHIDRPDAGPLARRPGRRSGRLVSRRRPLRVRFPGSQRRRPAVSVSEKVELHGHVLDSGALARTLDDILELGGDYVMERFEVGKRHEDESAVRLHITADNEELLQRILTRVQSHGANQVDPGDAVVREVDRDGVFPDDFYSTTNLATEVRLGGRWIEVQNPEMDCGLLVTDDGVRTIPVSDVKKDDRIVCT